MNFLHLGFLAALAGLAIPIVLHLMSREVPKRVVFPTIRYIFKGQRFQTGRRGIKDWLTLLSRLLLMAALILIFAHPFLPDDKAFVANSADEVLIFVDHSASMNASDFKTFLSDARGQITTAHPGATFGLLASNSQASVALATSTPNDEVMKALAALEPSLLRGNHFAALNQVPTLFSKREGVRRVLYILSDLQQQDWQREKLPALDLDAEVRVIQPPHSDCANLSIVKVEPELFAKGDVRHLRASVRVRNFALDSASADLRVEVGDVVASKSIELAGSSSEAYVFELDIPEAGSRALVSLVRDEPYQLDNSYHVSIGARPALRVAAIADLDRDRRKGIEAFFLRNALNVTLPGMTKIEVTNRGSDFIWDSDLSDYHAIFLFDSVAEYSELELEQFKAFCDSGGSLVYIAGQRAPDCLAKFADAKIANYRFLGWQGNIHQTETLAIDKIAEGFDLVAPFVDEPGDLKRFPIYKVAKIAAPKTATVLLAMDNQMPLLTRDLVGGGVFYVLSTSLSPMWSELPTSLSFLPLMRRLVELSPRAQGRGVPELIIGERYDDKLLAAGLPVETELPAEPGVILVDQRPIELNVTRDESDFRAIPDVEVAAALSVKTTGIAEFADPDAPKAVAGQDLRGPFAWALVAFLFFELFAANLQARRKEPAPETA
jgi:hypothetical protein